MQKIFSSLLVILTLTSCTRSSVSPGTGSAFPATATAGHIFSLVSYDPYLPPELTESDFFVNGSVACVDGGEASIKTGVSGSAITAAVTYSDCASTDPRTAISLTYNGTIHFILSVKGTFARPTTSKTIQRHELSVSGDLGFSSVCDFTADASYAEVTLVESLVSAKGSCTYTDAQGTTLSLSDDEILALLRTGRVTLPSTCQEAKAELIATGNASPEDGDYDLYVEGDSGRSWSAYCHNMDQSEPEEFLTVNSDGNYSQIVTDTHTMETHYAKYRIDPTTLKINPLDATFASTVNPGVTTTLTHVPAGYAQFGVASANGSRAFSEVDISATSFKFAQSIIDNPSSFLCTTSSGGDTSASERTFEETSLYLSAENTDQTKITTTVADCTNLGSGTITTAEWALQYVD